MCFVLLWNAGFFFIAIVDILSQKILVAPAGFWSKSATSLLHQTAWQAAEVAGTYSASEVDKATTSCVFELHEIAPDPRLNKKPDVLFLSSMLPRSHYQ